MAGLSAVVFYIGQTILVKVNLFLVVGLVGRHSGSSRISHVGGVARSAPVLAACFALPALSLAGLPPSSGFVGKFALIDAGAISEQWPIVVVALTVSLLTLYSMTKVWAGVFWGEAEVPLEGQPPRASVLMMLATGVTVALSVAYILAAGPIHDLATRAGTDLLEPSIYIDSVLGGEG